MAEPFTAFVPPRLSSKASPTKEIIVQQPYGGRNSLDAPDVPQSSRLEKASPSACIETPIDKPGAFSFSSDVGELEDKTRTKTVDDLYLRYINTYTSGGISMAFAFPFVYNQSSRPTAIKPRGSLPVRITKGSDIRILDLLPGKDNDSIECDIRTASLDSDLEYEAVSYVWGESVNKRSVRVSGHKVEVTNNLYDALRRLRNPHNKRALWIDQLCINQWDLEEKAHQVNLMRNIYKRCSRCLIWLGEIVNQSLSFSVEDAKSAFDFVRWASTAPVLHSRDLPTCFSSTQALERTHIAFKAMIMGGNPWWSRIWTVQEAVLPPRALVHWGPLSIEWEIFGDAALHMCHTTSISSQLEPFLDLLDKFTGPVRGVDIAKEGENALDLLQRWRYRDACDDRDKVYGLMGLFPNSPFPSVQFCNYELSTATLYTRITVDLLVLERGLRPLVGRRGEPHVTAGLPTWTLDLVRYPESKKRAWKWWNNSHRYREFSADRKMPFTWEPRNNVVLCLTGLFVDEVSHVSEILTEGEWGDLSDDKLAHLISQWESILNRYVSQQSKTEYATMESWHNAFYRTILGNLVMSEFPVRGVHDEDFHMVDEFRSSLSRNEIYLSLRDMIVNQAFFITKEGYIGIGPPTVTRGDEIWVLYGGQVPFILKRKAEGGHATRLGKATNNSFTFVGDAYVHGIMYGEALNSCDVEQETVLLH